MSLKANIFKSKRLTKCLTSFMYPMSKPKFRVKMFSIKFQISETSFKSTNMMMFKVSLNSLLRN